MDRADNANPQKATNATPSTLPAPARLIVNRYRVVGLLEKNFSAESLLATDLSTGAKVVVRLLALSPSAGGQRLHLEHEAEVLRKLNKPWLAPVLAVGREADRLYVVRPYVPGITLQKRLLRSRLDLPDTLTVGRCLLSALDQVHVRGVFHRDIRPANVIVGEESPLLAAVLTGFSLGCRLDATQWTDEEAIEAALYQSPEHAGALDCDVGQTSDLYSVGIVLFECLAGRPPFEGDSVGSILLRQMTSRVPKLRSMGLDVPRALDELLQRLMRKDPSDRYQTARAVLMDLEDLAESLRDGDGQSALVVGLHDRRPTLTEPALVGRGHELAQLDEQIRQVGGGRTATVFLEAQSGGGKTRLLSEIAVRGVQAGMWVLRGQGSEQVGTRPFQVLHGIVEELIAAARRDPALADAVKSRLGEHLDAVCAALPELAGAFGWETLGTLGPEAFGEARSIQALSVFLDAIGSVGRPVLIALDDYQWADEMTVKLVAHWHSVRSGGAQAGPRVLLVAAFRSEEVPADHLLRKTRPTLQLRLAALAGNEVQLLLESMAGPLPEEAVKVVHRLSDGSPFMASAVLRGMVESGALLAGADGWRVEPLALADLQSSSQAAGFLSRRIELLPPDTIDLLTAGAVLGKEFDRNLAAELAGLDPQQASTVLDQASQRHFVWAQPAGAECTFVHDKIRAALLQRITPRRRGELHHSIARRLEQDAPERIYDLAYHFDAAGESGLALPYALAAAEQARSRHALEVAEQQHRIAQRGEASADRATQYRIREGLGEVLMLRGKYREAKQTLEDAAALAEGDYARAQIKGKLGELDFKQGDMESAIDAFEEASRLLGGKVPPKMPASILMLLWEAGIQLLHCSFPRMFVGRRKGKPSEAELLRLRLFSRLAYGYFYTRGRIQNFWVHLHDMNLAERYAPTLELAQIYSEHAVAMTLLGWYRRGLAYARKSLAIRLWLGDLWGQGQSLSFYGVVLYAASRFAECIEKCRQGVRLLERTGDYWEMHIARYQIAASLYRLGDMQGAVAEARAMHQSGLELGDEQASGISLDVWSLATGGRVPEEILQREVRRQRPDAQSTAQVLLAEGVRLTEAGRHEQAVGVFEQALVEGRRLGLMSAYTAPNLAWLATALRRHAESLRQHTPARRSRLLYHAERAARRALRVARRLQNDLPHALRELALIRAARGRTRRLQRLLNESLEVARRQGARHELAQTLRVYGQLGKELNWPDADERTRAAATVLGELAPTDQPSPAASRRDAPPATLSLADRFDTVLDAGRKIASALSPASIFDQARAASLQLLRGEHCALFEVTQQEGESRFAPLDGREDDGSHDAMLGRALRAGQAVACVEEVSGNTSDRAASTGKRSALCVPFYVRGRAVACLHVTHDHVHRLFGPDEERLADFIATIAGAALENAEGFAELEQLNQTLERRVAERTAAAEARARELARSNRELERTANELRRAEEDLRLAKQAAEAANEAKSRFLATMSHEIRTPLNGVRGMTELVLNTSLTDQQRNHLSVARDSADALLEILNDTLDFSKIEAGKMELERVAFSIRDVVGAAAGLLAVTASRKGLELSYRVAGDVPRQTIGDPGRLRQIIVNLVGNAVKFTTEGEVFVNVWTEAGPRATVHFAVEDTGIGIPADKKECIFEAFRQSDNSMTRRFGGTGLGLAVSAQLVALMEGKVWVESEVGRGSAFHFVVPFDLPEKSTEPPPTPRPALRGTVLVAGANRNVQRTCGEILRECGMRVETAADVETTMAALRRDGSAEEPPVLALIDVGPTCQAGLELAEQLRGDEIARRVPLVILVPPGHAESTERCSRLGAAQCLAKPVNPAKLVQAAAAALEVRPQRPAGQESLGKEKTGRSLHILVADDSPINQEVAIGLLQLRGHEVQTVGDGRAAVEAFQRQKFDLILMDVEMPEMDGLAATALIRQIEKEGPRRTPIIAMTAHALKGFQDRCLEAGMDGYVSKPIRPNELFQALETATAAGPEESRSAVEAS